MNLGADGVDTRPRSPSSGLKVIAAPNSFKGSLTATDVAAAIAEGARRLDPTILCRQIPLADGGEGTVSAFLGALGGSLVTRRVTGPLGDPVEAAFGILDDGVTAVIEMAAASGLGLVAGERRDPLIATTYGTGELIKAAIELGRRRIIVGLGGSATVDGGAGAAQALGARLLHRSGRELPPGGAALADLDRIEADRLAELTKGIEVTVASDVDNPLCGPNGAAPVFGPQKGATAEMVTTLDAALANFGRVIARDLGRPVTDRPGAGAAGGFGAGLMGFLDAKLVSGIDLILEMVGFEAQLAWADLVITGEGRVDRQTLHGKGPYGVARAATAAGRSTIVLAGSVGPGASDLERGARAVVLPIVDRPMPLEAAMEEGVALVAAAVERGLRLFLMGRDSDHPGT
ncbi:MAG TPA: glycerate kinase [Bacillota bacterium]|jgi:glycerate kinase